MWCCFGVTRLLAGRRTWLWLSLSPVEGGNALKAVCRQTTETGTFPVMRRYGSQQSKLWRKNQRKSFFCLRWTTWRFYPGKLSTLPALWTPCFTLWYSLKRHLCGLWARCYVRTWIWSLACFLCACLCSIHSR